MLSNYNVSFYSNSSFDLFHTPYKDTFASTHRPINESSCHKLIKARAVALAQLPPPRPEEDRPATEDVAEGVPQGTATIDEAEEATTITIVKIHSSM